MPTPEHARLREVTDDSHGWRRWGPYLSDRAWATVREDYSANGDAWGFLPHDLARSKAYRWGEDGIAGWCDRYQLLCFAPAFWNERDPIIKERLFGLTPHEGNHGEDVKEYYFYLDGLPTHSYMKCLYKYPQAEFPYCRLVEENGRRGASDFEFELLDTGVFDDDRYFDIFIEYAKFDAEDVAIRIEAINRGPEPAALRVLPHLWFRNTWSWGPIPGRGPQIELGSDQANHLRLITCDSGFDTLTNLPVQYRLGPRTLYAPKGGAALFTDNETNADRVARSGFHRRVPYTKDAFHRAIVNGEACTNPSGQGTKACVDYRLEIPAGGAARLDLRLSDKLDLTDPLAPIGSLLAKRRAEADAFYSVVHPARATDDERRMQRQAFAGLLWSKQCYLFDVSTWLDGDSPELPPPAARRFSRNAHWRHLNSMRVMPMPDKWEYPWFAAWDHAFHCVALALIDPKYAMEQLWILLFEQFQHPSGQIPAYEWEFSDLNPPVHAWAVWRVFHMARLLHGHLDRPFLERCFHKLLMNFAWWVNKVDSAGNNIFEGGFLGLDNITVVDRSEACADGSVLEQSDASGWMGMFCVIMMRIALELAKENHVYESLATKFFQHYAYVAAAMKHMGGREYQLWDDDDGFFYDVLRHADGGFVKFRIRSLVGLIPLFAVERLEVDWIAPFRDFTACLNWFLHNREDLVRDVVHTVERDGQTTHVLTIVNQTQLTRIVQRLWDESEFLSPHGIRSLSKAHAAAPFQFDGRMVGYEPAEARTKIKGGNSNWRGPVWMPINFLLIEALRKLGKAYGPMFEIPLPCANGQPITFPELARQLTERLISLYRRDENGRRPVFGGTAKFQQDQHWRDHLLFYEYFHGDNGAGLGASHQAGWTAMLACLIDEWRR